MPGEFTALLRTWSLGDRSTRSEIWPSIYDELKVVARSVVRKFRHPQAPGTTSLVHEAALRLLDLDIDWSDRHHFFAAAARAMRFVAVDDARKRLAQKRGADAVVQVEDLSLLKDPETRNPEEVLAVHQALDRLAEVNERHERLVELRYFAGMTVDETADLLGVSVPTVVRDWKAVRVWMHGQLRPEEVP